MPKKHGEDITGIIDIEPLSNDLQLEDVEIDSHEMVKNASDLTSTRKRARYDASFRIKWWNLLKKARIPALQLENSTSLKSK